MAVIVVALKLSVTIEHKFFIVVLLKEFVVILSLTTKFSALKVSVVKLSVEILLVFSISLLLKESVRILCTLYILLLLKVSVSIKNVLVKLALLKVSVDIELKLAISLLLKVIVVTLSPAVTWFVAIKLSVRISFEVLKPLVVVFWLSVTYWRLIKPLNSLNLDCFVTIPSTTGISSLPLKLSDSGKLEIGTLHMAILLFIHHTHLLFGAHMQEWLIC